MTTVLPRNSARLRAACVRKKVHKACVWWGIRLTPISLTTTKKGVAETAARKLWESPSYVAEVGSGQFALWSWRDKKS